MIRIFDELPLWSAPFGLTLLDTVRPRQGISILDIGCGSGFPMLELAGRFGLTCRVFGIDPEPASFGTVNRKIRRNKTANAEVVTAVAEQMPFGDGTFGLIVSNNGMNNTADEKRALSECSRVASSGCQMVLTMNLPHTFNEFYNLFEQALSQLKLNDEIRKMKEHVREKRKPAGHWKESILDAGFTITTMNIDGFRMRFADGTSFLHHPLIRSAFLPSWELIIPKGKVKEVFGIIAGQLDRKAAEEKELIMSVPFLCIDCFKP